jgi:hypothetical protein
VLRVHSSLDELDRLGTRGYLATGRQQNGTSSATGPRAAAPGSRVEAMSRRLRRGGHRSRCRLRKQTVEPVLGQIKGARGFRQFHLRGLAHVAEEWRLICLAHDLLKPAQAR